jgi:hypothetical protein
VIAETRIFTREIERFDHLSLGEKVKRTSLIGGEGARTALPSPRPDLTFEMREEAGSPGYPRVFAPVRKAESLNLILGRVWVLIDRERPKRGSKPASTLSMTLLHETRRAVGTRRPELREGDRLRGLPQASAHRAKVRPVFFERGVLPRDRPAREDLVCGRGVVDIRVVKGADDREAIGALG